MMEMESLLVAKCVCWLLRIWGSNRPAERVATIGGGGRAPSERGCEDPHVKETEFPPSKAVTKCGVSNCPNLSVPLFSSLS